MTCCSTDPSLPVLTMSTCKKTSTDFCVLRNDVAAIENCSSSSSLHFNISKCKYMIISQKRTPTTPASPILLNGIPLERVELFKHLGLIISSHVSWSSHITSICAKPKRILGLLYRQYYNHVEGHVLKQLYISLIRPHAPGMQLCCLGFLHTEGQEEP